MTTKNDKLNELSGEVEILLLTKLKEACTAGQDSTAHTWAKVYLLFQQAWDFNPDSDTGDN